MANTDTLSSSRKKFYCREWAFSKLSSCLDSRPGSKAGGALILGGAGCGKSTLCAELVWPGSGVAARPQRALSRRLLAYHFLSQQHERSLSVEGFIRGVATQLLNHTTESQRERSLRRRDRDKYHDSVYSNVSEPSLPPSPRTLVADAYLEKLKSDPEISACLRPRRIEASPDDCLKRALLFPLLEIEPPRSALLLLVDGIDEANTGGTYSASSKRTVAELLAQHHHLLPHWLLLVCTARKQSRAIGKMFSGFRKLCLDDLRKVQVVRDVQQYILARLDAETSLRQHITRDTAEMLNQLHIKSNGCFLYLERVLDGVASGWVALREVRDIPGTLNGLYLWLCQRLFSRKQFLKVVPLLSVLLATRRPLTAEELQAAVQTALPSVSAESFQRRIHLLARLLVTGPRGHVALFHHSFGDWLQDIKHCTHKYLCSQMTGHAILAMYYSVLGPSLSIQETLDLALHLNRTEQLLEEQQNTSVPQTNTQDSQELDRHTILLLWLILSSAPVDACILDADHAAESGLAWPSDLSARRLLLEAGAAEPDTPEPPPDPTIPTRVASPGPPSTQSSPSPGESPAKPHALVLASRLGQASLAAALLAAGASPSDPDPDGWTPLRAAAWAGHAQCVKVLASAGAPLDAPDQDGRTALRAAAWAGHEEVVRALVEHGADVNMTDLEGRTALIAAAYMGHADICELLVDAGAEVNHADADGRTALSVAALSAPSTVLQSLLERGAHVDHQDREGMTPLLVAAFEGHRDVCELLLEYEADIEHSDSAGRTPLWAAASMGHAPVVSLLLFWGCSVDGMDSEGRTVLAAAAAQGCAEVVRLLLDRGLDELHRDNSGWTPLHYAAWEGHTLVCEALLDAGARVDEADNEGKGALALASQAGHASVVELLLQRRAPVDQRAHDGKTPLRLAALEGHYDVLQLLLEAGADVDAVDADGRSTLYVVALDGRLGAARALLAAGACVESRDAQGRTPLHVAAWQGHTDLTALLLGAGRAAVDAADSERRTALHSAAWQGHAAVVRLLLQHGAAPDHACSQGATALGIAAQEGHEACVRALLEHGADPSLSDSCGRNALRVAAKSGHRGVVRLLEDYSLQQRQPHSSSTNSIASASTAETKPSSAVLALDWGAEQRRSCVSLGNHSSNSKSSSNLTGSSQSSGTGTGPAQQPLLQPPVQPPVMSFREQLEQCSRGIRTRPASKLLSPLQSEPQSPIYASPPLSPTHDQEPELSLGYAFADHFGRDTHMRIILGHTTQQQTVQQQPVGPSTGGKGKRNGIVTNPALRLVANVRNGLDAAGLHLRKGGQGHQPPHSKTHSFQWRKETPL